jgi:hypothetical protein
VDQAIKKLILEAFDDAYLNALSNEVVGYANCTSLDFLTHLLTFYAMISPTELTQNYERLNTPYDPNQPMETLFQQIQVVEAIMTQLSLKASLKEWGEEAFTAAQSEMKQLYFRTTFKPNHWRELS